MDFDSILMIERIRIFLYNLLVIFMICGLFSFNWLLIVNAPIVKLSLEAAFNFVAISSHTKILFTSIKYDIYASRKIINF